MAKVFLGGVMKRYLIIGQGAIGLPVAVELARRGLDVTGLARTAKVYPKMDNAPKFIQKNANELHANDLMNFSHILIIVTPDKNADRVMAYRDSYLKICQHIANIYKENPSLFVELARVYFLSSTSVYGQDNGEVVDEYTQTMPLVDTAKVLEQAEKTLQAVFLDKATMIRASGIYGVDRTRLIDMAYKQKPKTTMQYTNRIMDTDLVNVVANLMSDDGYDKGVYLATDLKPVLMGEVLDFIGQQLGLNDIQDTRISPVTGKRVVSNINPDWLMFKDYQQGYMYILNEHVPKDVDKFE